jgi:hypothetical protein
MITLFTKLTSPVAVYIVAFIAMAETAVESFTDYALLGLGWGDRFELEMPHLGAADPILADLQPLFDALRK